MHEARRRARAAAEKRRTLAVGSGQKLGGAPVARGRDMRRVIADAVAKRNTVTVTKGCASGTERGRGIVEETTRNGFRTKAEEEDANEEAIMQAYIEMIQEEEREIYGDSYVQPSHANPAGSQGKTTSSKSLQNAPTTFQSTDTKLNPQEDNSLIDLTDQDPPSNDSSPTQTSPSNSWTCEICTLSNPQTYLCCDACGTERLPSSYPQSQDQTYQSPQASARSPHGASNPSLRPQPSKSIKSLSSLDASTSKKPLGWLCHRCGTFMENEWWTCAGCGTMKLTS